jgi:16S rRNA (adenine1518-N6/adenine1519-N6)-dimethyltransferase
LVAGGPFESPDAGDGGSAGRRGPLPGRRQRRLGQNFLADTNLLDAIVADAEISPDDVVLEVGGGAGVLTERLADAARFVHLIELDRGLAVQLEPLADRLGNVGIIWEDALKADLSLLDPPPTKMVANLPYSIATPLLIRTIVELPTIEHWLVMVQKEIADRLTAGPGSKTYGSPSVVVGVGCEARVLEREAGGLHEPAARAEHDVRDGQQRRGVLREDRVVHQAETGLGALGEGGLVTTRDAKLADQLRLLRDWGGRNAKLHGLADGRLAEIFKIVSSD